MAEEVMKLNAQLAREVRETGATFTLDDLDQHFQAMLQRLEETGVYHRGVPYPRFNSKLWLQAQLATIQKLAKGERL